MFWTKDDKKAKEEVLGEVDLMNKSFSDLHEGDALTDSPATDPPAATDAPTTDEPTDDEMITDAPTDDLVTDEPKTEPPTTDAPDERDQTIADLRAKLAEKDSGPKPTAPPATVAPLVFEPQDFIGDENVEDITSNKESLNKLLNIVYSKGVTDSRSIVGGGVAEVIPSLVTSQINMVTQMKETRDNFYVANEDLRSFPDVVSTVFDDIAKKNPDETYGNIIKAVAPEVRKRLNLPEHKPGNNDKKSGKGNPPNLPRKKGKPGRSQTKPKTSPIESELDEMNEVLGR